MATRRAYMRTPVDPEDQILATVLRHTLPMEEMNARQLCRKNAKALGLAIEQLGHARTGVAAKVKAAWLAKA